MSVNDKFISNIRAKTRPLFWLIYHSNMTDMPRQFLTSQNNQLFSKQRHYSRCKEHSSRQEEFILVSTRVQGNFLKCRWLNGVVTPRADKPDKIVPDGARPKNGWFYLASWTRSLQETSRKWSRLCQTILKLPFVYKTDRIWCCLYSTIWPTSANLPCLVPCNHTIMAPQRGPVLCS